MKTDSSGRRKSRVCGTYPATLYRCFDKKEYAEQFVADGKFRVGLMDVYKDIECHARRDATEGIGAYGLKGPVTVGRVSRDPRIPTEWSLEDGVQKHQTETGSSVFLLCCANTSVDLPKLRHKFGQHVVKIVSPVSFAIDLDYALNGKDGTQGAFLVCGKDVEYNKGQLIEDGRTPEELTDLAYSQKPVEFEGEKEFRFCLIAMGEKYLSHLNTQKFLEINLGVDPYYLKLLAD